MRTAPRTTGTPSRRPWAPPVARARRQPPPPRAATTPHALPPLALKEWAVLVAALAAGDATLLLRRGGVRDTGFVVEAPRFVLLPTSFHVDAAGLDAAVAAAHARALMYDAARDGVTLTHAAEVTGAWVVADGARAAEATRAFHRLSPAGVAARLKGTEHSKPVTLLEVRAFELERPVVMPPPAAAAAAGCRAWADLTGLQLPATLDTARPCLDDDAFAQRAAGLRAALAGAAATAAELDVGALGSRDD